MLERSWSFCAVVFVGVVCTSLGGSALVLYATGGYDDSAGVVTTPLRKAASHIVTMMSQHAKGNAGAIVGNNHDYHKHCN